MSQILKNLPVGSYAVIFPSLGSGIDEEGHEKLLAELYLEDADEITVIASPLDTAICISCCRYSYTGYNP